MTMQEVVRAAPGFAGGSLRDFNRLLLACARAGDPARVTLQLIGAGETEPLLRVQNAHGDPAGLPGPLHGIFPDARARAMFAAALRDAVPPIAGLADLVNHFLPAPGAAPPASSAWNRPNCWRPSAPTPRSTGRPFPANSARPWMRPGRAGRRSWLDFGAWQRRWIPVYSARGRASSARSGAALATFAPPPSAVSTTTPGSAAAAGTISIRPCVRPAGRRKRATPCSTCRSPSGGAGP